MSIEDLLQTTSRTFALSIPLLPEPLNDDITLAYLVFRIADTIEDADHLSRDERCCALEDFHGLLHDCLSQSNSEEKQRVEQWAQQYQSVSDNEHYNRLVAETARVFRLVGERRPAARVAIQRHASRSVLGMKETLRRADIAGNLTLGSVDELRQYCYFVAGIVGEMITELFLSDHDQPSREGAEHQLQNTSAAFGEALQLVNILKDSGDDAICGRAYLPPNVPRERIHQLADERIRDAEVYVRILREISASPGMIAFCDAPLQLAKRTLEVVAKLGPGSKVPRDETLALLQQVIERSGLVM